MCHQFYSGPHSWIWDGMRDMLRNSGYDVTVLMKAAQDLEDEHALDWEQQQVSTKTASTGYQGDSPLRLDVSTEPLLEAESQMRAFTKEVNAWISECKTWNPKCKLARAKNAQGGTGAGYLNWGVVKITTIANGGLCNVSLPIGGQLRIVRIKVVRGIWYCRICHRTNPSSSMRVVHPCATNVGVGGTSAITEIVPRTTPNKDE